MSGCKGPITTFIVEPFIPHDEEFYLNIVSERLGCSLSFSECGGIDIEENWDKVWLNAFISSLSQKIQKFFFFFFFLFVITWSFYTTFMMIYDLFRSRPSLFQQEHPLHRKYVLHLLPPFLWRYFHHK